MIKMGRKHKKHKLEKTAYEEKPLKLVLKVGGTETVAGGSSEPVADLHDGKKHKHKKKKKKHKHDKQEKDVKRDLPVVAFNEDSMIADENDEPPAKKALFMDEDSSCSRGMLDGCGGSYGNSSTSLQECLYYLHKVLLRKDMNGFFAYPVTDSIAPGYSSMITIPMDFSTMKHKINRGQYTSVQEFKKDFRLMCNNCCVYNRPETIYYKEGKRILSTGLKHMAREKLLTMRRTLPFMADITNEELGIEVDEIPGADVSMTDSPTSQARANTSKVKVKKQKPSPFEAFQDDLTADEILAQAQEAAKEAKQELTLRRPNSRVGFLRRKHDGTTTLNLINPDNSGIVGPREKVVNLGALVGKLPVGTGNMVGFREDKRNKATPVLYMNYGPFSSHGPSYDSSFSTLCKEDSDRLLATYNDETGAQYAKSMQSFVDGASDYAIKMVDSLLDVLTHGDHSKYLRELKQKEEQDRAKVIAEQLKKGMTVEPQLKQEDCQPLQHPESGRSLADMGIDMSFLESLEDRSQEGSADISNQLQQASDLLGSLQEVQHQRLSLRLPAHLAHCPQPSGKEIELASKVTKQLTSLAKQAPPGGLASGRGLHSAMGLAHIRDSISSVTSTSQLDEDDEDSENIVNPFAPSNSEGDLTNDISEFFQTTPTTSMGVQSGVSNTDAVETSMLPSMVLDALDSPMDGQVDSTTN